MFDNDTLTVEVSLDKDTLKDALREVVHEENQLTAREAASYGRHQ